MLPEKIRQLDVAIGAEPAGELLKHSVYEFRYRNTDIGIDTDRPAVALLMPRTDPTYQDGDLFAVMDQNLPEGDLYLRLRALFPKQQLTPMHLLALIGSNGIGRRGVPASRRRPSICRMMARCCWSTASTSSPTARGWASRTSPRSWACA